MKMWMLPIAASLLLGCASTGQTPAAPRKATKSTDIAKSCGDLLAGIGRKPVRARYTGCAVFAEEQGVPMRATYEVTGRDAAAVETELIRTTGLKPLTRSCCQWDDDFSSFEDGQGGRLLITMVSDQGPVTRREDWSKIARFLITVTKYIEEP